MQHLPLWFPGAGFKRKAITWKAKMEEFVDKPFEFVKARMVRCATKYPTRSQMGISDIFVHGGTAGRHCDALFLHDPA